jgi:undecaprenyl diphosphate synthase
MNTMIPREFDFSKLVVPKLRHLHLDLLSTYQEIDSDDDRSDSYRSLKFKKEPVNWTLHRLCVDLIGNCQDLIDIKVDLPSDCGHFPEIVASLPPRIHSLYWYNFSDEVERNNAASIFQLLRRFPCLNYLGRRYQGQSTDFFREIGQNLYNLRPTIVADLERHAMFNKARSSVLLDQYVALALWPLILKNADRAFNLVKFKKRPVLSENIGNRRAGPCVIFSQEDAIFHLMKERAAGEICNHWSSKPRNELKRKRVSSPGGIKRRKFSPATCVISIVCMISLFLTTSTCAFSPSNDGTFRRTPSTAPNHQTRNTLCFSSSRIKDDADCSLHDPKHVALICDGNSRWAREQKLPTSMGHCQGADRLVELLETMTSTSSSNIDFVTLYGFSTENWKRSSREVREIFQVMEMTARAVLWNHKRQYHQNQSTSKRPVQVRILGDLDDERIPNGLRDTLRELEDVTARDASNDKGGTKALTLCLAINYGGRQDIVQAFQRLAIDVAEGKLDPQSINVDTIANQLSTSDIPDPDIIIRTSGECRLSNFLLWNCAYAELYFTDTLWPDFDARCWEEALQWYQRRQRRFGARKESDDDDNDDASSSSTIPTIPSPLKKQQAQEQLEIHHSSS